MTTANRDAHKKESRMDLALDRVKEIYRHAIDPNASATEGVDWWTAVSTEANAVIRARSAKAAASIIDWWHPEWEWEQLGDDARAAATRIRNAARALSIS